MALTTVFLAASLAGTPAEDGMVKNSGPNPASYADFFNNLSYLPNNFDGTDDRVKITDTEILPWSAIGKLDFGYDGSATAFLVAPNIIMTAGHCVLGRSKIAAPDMEGEIIIPDEEVMFHPGYKNGISKSAARAVLFFRPYSFYDRSVRHDYAFALLDRPAGNEAGWLEVLDIPASDIEKMIIKSDVLYQAGYSLDAAEEMTGNIACRIIGTESGCFFHDCDVLPGDSGSPLIVQRNGRFFVIGIQHNITTMKGREAMVGYAAPVSLMKEQLQDFKKYSLNPKKMCEKQISPEKDLTS
jgi:protease YdgD